MDIIEQLRALVGDRYVATGIDVGGFAHDWAGGLTWTPLCVVRPASTQEVSAVLSATYAANIPVVPVAGNTTVSGGCYAEGAVMLSLERLNKIEDINPTAKTARVQSGVIVEKLHAAVDDYDLVFPLLFGAQGTAQIGGALSTNAGGSNVIRFGNTRALCLGIEAVMPDGRIMNLMTALHKDNTGYDLKDLMIGAEGTLGVITAAIVKLYPKPRSYFTAMLAFETIEAANQTLEIVQNASGHGVEAYECMPEIYIDRHMERIHGAREPFDARHPINILCQVAATSDHDGAEDETGATKLVSRLEDVLGAEIEAGNLSDAVIAKSQAEFDEMWARRDTAAELALADKPYVGSDVAVPTDRVSEFLERADLAIQTADPDAKSFYVAHLGDGNIHYTVKISSEDYYDGVTEEIETIVQDMGGSFSAEHGVGYFKRGSMARRKDPVALEVMKSIKAALDPKGLMNPDKIFP